MTDGQRARRGGGLQRHPTMSAGGPMRSVTMDAAIEAPDNDHSAAYADADGIDYDDPSSYPAESAYEGIQQDTWDPAIGNDSTWRNTATGSGDWRYAQQNSNVDELTNSLGNIDIQQQGQQPNYARGGPRFEAGAGGYQDHYAQQLQQARQNALTQSQRLQLNTEIPAPTGPASASAFVPPLGHAPRGSVGRESIASLGSGEDHSRSVSSSERDPKGRMLKGRGSNPNINQTHQGQFGGVFGHMPPPPSIPTQYLNQVQSGRFMSGGNVGASAAGYTAGNGQQFGGSGIPGQQAGIQQQPPTLDPMAFLASPIDVPTMIAQKGYNPATFDTRPAFVSRSTLEGHQVLIIC
jgi:YTH domain-containing family protein